MGFKLYVLFGRGVIGQAASTLPKLNKMLMHGEIGSNHGNRTRQ
ncbi:MAG: hypothetical protein ACI87E_001520 [Mariniblastus sp.]|jgi:hypothetical protein